MGISIADTRPSWNEYFLRIANDVALRSNCSRRNVGAVIVKDNRILSTGYNGTPMHTKNCFDGGCPRCGGETPSGHGLDECMCVHAEQNAICQAAMYGIPIVGSTIYVTIWPCLTCSKLIINAGIKNVVYGGNYTADLDKVEKLLSEGGVELIHFDLEKEQRDRFTKAIVECLHINSIPEGCEFVLEEPPKRDNGRVDGYITFNRGEVNGQLVYNWLEKHGFIPHLLGNSSDEPECRIVFYAPSIQHIRGDE